MIRWRLLLLIFVFNFGLQRAFAQSLDSLDNANAAYLLGDYPSAIQYFELTVQAGITTGEIYYNLANAYYESNDIGRALLNYRRAQQFLPRDLDLSIQFARIRSVRTTLQGETTDWIIRLVEVTETLLSINELSLLSFILWIILFVGFSLYRLKTSWRKTLRIPLFVWISITALTLLLLGSRLYVYYRMPPAVVIAQSTPVMSGPSIAYFEQYEFFAGTEVYFIDQQDGWQKFVTADGKQGWIQSEALEGVIIPK